MRPLRVTQRALLAIPFLAAAFQSAAASEIGTFVAVRGGVEVRRASAGEWKAATIGAPIYVSDEIRSDQKGRAKLFFRDAAVADLGSESTLSIKRYDSGKDDNVLHLIAGRLRVFLSDTERAANARFEVETPTAVVRAEGTVFIVEYSESEKLTQVYGVEGIVEVQGSIGLIGPSLKVGPLQATRVQEGKFPEPVEAKEATAVAAMGAELEVIGTGRSDGYAATHPLLTGAITRSEEKPSAVRIGASADRAATGVSYVAPGVPGETLLERLSPAMRANTQPIDEYDRYSPIEVPPTLR